MATGHQHPTDRLVDELMRLYADNSRRLEAIVQAGLRRGLDPARLGTLDATVGDATLAYRKRQREQADAILDGLARQAGQVGPLIVGRAYGSGVVTIDKIATRTGTGRAGVAGQFGRVHVRAVEALASSMTGALAAAAERAKTNVATVFARADALDGAIPTGGRVAGVPFVGRRIDDPYRNVALDTVAGGLVALDTRKQVSANLARRLVNDGVTDALTGFVDRRGRRWSLQAYAEMVARTTTREATTQATGNRMAEHGLDLVTISDHPHPADECTEYEGRTFSLTGSTPGYDVLDVQPPFHPNAVIGDEQIVTPVGEVLSAVRAVYDGPAVEIEGASGVRLTVSPNHPVLTRRGWLPARLVHKGDEIVRDCRRDRPVRRSVAHEDLDHMPARAADVFHALDATGARRTAIAAATDLHGDAAYCEREVDVIRSYRELRRHLDAAVTQEAEQFALRGAGRYCEPLARPRAFEPALERILTPVAGPLPDGYPERGEPPAERGGREWTSACEVLTGCAGEIARDKVVEVRYRDRFRAHAYDFQTTSGLYYVGSIAVHNCVHVMVPAGENLDAFEAALADNLYAPPSDADLEARTTPPPPPPAPPAAPAAATTIARRHADRPFAAAQPNVTPASPKRREDERRAYGSTAPPSPADVGELLAGDPGADPGAAESWQAWVAKEERAANRALNTALGPDLARFIDQAAGKRAGIRRRLHEREITVEQAEQEAYEIYAQAEAKRLLREHNEQTDYGLQRRALPCFSCGQLKRRPSDVCAHCGDDPVQPSVNANEADNADRQKFDRAYGYGGNY